MGLGPNTTSLIPNHDEVELFKFIVNEGNGVKGLADSNIASLPPRYVHPPNERIDPKQVIDASLYLAKPIDLSGLEGEKKGEVIDTLCGAAEKLGFFQVVNHGVPLELLERAKKAAHTFFNMPPEKKSAFLKEKTPCRRVHYGTSFLPAKEKSLEWKDYLSMVYASDEEAMEFWPQECRDAVLDYMKAANKMVYAILSTLLRGLGVELDESAMTQYVEARGVNMNYYPICPRPELTVGVGRHSDLATLTILLQDDIGGLFVKVEDKGWIEIPPVEGALVINVGDTLEILSNGRYKSAWHRAIVNSTMERISVASFICPEDRVVIGPAKKLTDDGTPPVYRSFTFDEYYKKFLSRSLGDEHCLELFKN